jgi:natural product biosynthesis luciferase-like monooxygenase protein
MSTTTLLGEAPRGAAERRALLARLLDKRADDETFPLSFSQQRLWFLHELQPDVPVYNVPLAWSLHGTLDVPALGRALDTLVERHEALRTAFHSVAGEPRQRVRSHEPLHLPVVDLRAEHDPAAAARLRERELANRPFDLSQAPLLRAELLRLDEQEHRFVLVMHHLVCDGWSAGLLMRELAVAYSAWGSGKPPNLPELRHQYRDFARWQHQQVNAAAGQEALAYWKQRLAGLEALDGLPTDRPRPAVQSYRGAQRSFDTGPALLARVEALARGAGASPFMVLLATFALLLRRWSGVDDVALGTPIANRAKAEWEGVLGFFTNTLVMRCELRGSATFRELLAAVRARANEAYAHQDLPFERLVEELQPQRNLAKNPLFSVFFSFREDELESLRLAGLRVTPWLAGTPTAKFDLSLSLARVEGSLHGRLEYATDLYGDATAERFERQFLATLERVTRDPDQRLSQIDVLPASERTQVLQTFACGPRVAVEDTHILAGFEVQARQRPAATALRYRNEAVGYGELAQRVEHLARHLQALGVRAGAPPVGLFVDRTPELVIALLAILQAGGSYLPLDPGYPVERLGFMLADAGTRLVLTRRALLTSAPVTSAQVLAVDDLGLVALGETQPLAHRAAADAPAYVIYTSGSTGTPKGVMVTQATVTNFFAGMDALLMPGEPGTWLAVTSVSFDISVLELLWTLARGFEVVLAPDGALPRGAAQMARQAPAKPLEFSLFYFAADLGSYGSERYRLLLEGARFADRNDFCAVWTPERHFHAFGGLYPNPAVVSAALAALTERVQIRAGSVVLPLHDPLTVAEEWSVVDNLSRGRVGLSLASGWQPNDFVLAPDAYAHRREIMLRGLDELRRLWRGQKVQRRSGSGAEVEVGIFPPPVQAELPLWITSARHVETFRLAGEQGTSLLTHLLGHDIAQLTEKIAAYRAAWRAAGHAGEGHVTLMLHTFVGADVESVRATVRRPLCEYLKTSFDLLADLGGVLAPGLDLRSLPEADLDALVERAFERFFETAALLGTPTSCLAQLERVRAAGVDEVACLIDFGVQAETVLEALEPLGTLARRHRDVEAAARTEPSLAQLLQRHRPTHLQSTPSLAQALLAEPEARAALSGVEALLLGGEALPPALARELREHLPGRIFNMYGPTETTVWSTAECLDQVDEPLTIGRPLANQSVFVLDCDGQPAPIGVPGEVLIGGAGVTPGYVGRPELTAERFVERPDLGPTAARAYRTGDLARWRADGRLEFLGRRDGQIKLRGHRIELGELEAALGTHPDVRLSAAALHGQGAAAHLLAYVVPTPGRRPDPAALQAYLAQRLPAYMLPAAVVLLERLPQTPNGKLDRRALPASAAARSRGSAAFEAPGTRTERAIAAVWRELLNSDEIGLDDNFFELGGNSLSIVRVRARLAEELGASLSLVDMFKYPSVRLLAVALEGQTEDRSGREAAEHTAGRRRGALRRRGQTRLGARS